MAIAKDAEELPDKFCNESFILWLGGGAQEPLAITTSNKLQHHEQLTAADVL